MHMILKYLAILFGRWLHAIGEAMETIRAVEATTVLPGF